MIGRLHGVVIDCPDPSALAHFYERLLGWIRVQDDGDWVVIGEAVDRVGLAFARAAGFRAPTWPAPEVQQQMHFDIKVDDLDSAEAAALRLGATRRDYRAAERTSASSPIPPATRSASASCSHPYCRSAGKGRLGAPCRHTVMVRAQASRS